VRSLSPLPRCLSLSPNSTFFLSPPPLAIIISSSQPISAADDRAHGWPTLRAFERRGLKRWVEAYLQPPSATDDDASERVAASKPLPWEWDLRHISHHHPTSPQFIPAAPSATASTFARTPPAVCAGSVARACVEVEASLTIIR
jgi:hypothetical protein